MSNISKRRLKGEGTIRHRSDGRWEGRVPLGRIAGENKISYKYVYGKTLPEVKEKMDHVKKLYGKRSSDGRYFYIDSKGVRTKRLTMSEWIDRWLMLYKLNKVAPSTYESYRTIAENHIKPSLGGIYIDELITDDIQLFLNKLGEGNSRKDGKLGCLAYSSIRKVKIVIKAALKQAVTNRMIAFNPAEGIVIQKSAKVKFSVLSVEDQRKFIEALKGQRLEALYILALATGMRKGEILALTWSDIDFEKKLIRVNKSVSRVRDEISKETYIKVGPTKTINGERLIPMLSTIIPLLKNHKLHQEAEKKKGGRKYNINNLVFCSSVGRHIEARRINTTLDKIVKKAGINHINFHALRHTFATRALEYDIPAKVVQEILGHSDVSFTLNRYSHVFNSIVTAHLKKMDDIFLSDDLHIERDKIIKVQEDNQQQNDIRKLNTTNILLN